MDDLKHKLFPAGVSTYEVLDLIASHYKSATSRPDGYIAYPKDEPRALVIRCEKGTVVSVEPGPGLDPNDLVTIRERIDEVLITSEGLSIERSILFSNLELRGSLSLPHLGLQLLPAPPSAPRPRYALGLRPFVIEFQIPKSSDRTVMVQRRMDALLEWTWLLNVLLRCGVENIDHARHFWALVPPENGGPVSQKHIAWLQQFYHVDRFKVRVDEFSRPGTDTLPSFPYREYFVQTGLPLGEGMSIPDNIEQLIAVFLALPPKERRQFRLACRWVYAADQCSPLDLSPAFICRIAAIEGLMAKPKSPPRCNVCKKELDGPTRRFSEFVNKLAAEWRVQDDLLDPLYGMRSRLAHGGRVLATDDLPVFTPFTTTYVKESQSVSAAFRISRLALISWLLERV